MQIIEKYLRLIKEKTSQRDLVQDYLEKKIGLSDFNFDIVGDKVKLECSSQDRFMLKMHEEEWHEFLRSNKLRAK